MGCRGWSEEALLEQAQWGLALPRASRRKRLASRRKRLAMAAPDRLGLPTLWRLSTDASTTNK